MTAPVALSSKGAKEFRKRAVALIDDLKTLVNKSKPEELMVFNLDWVRFGRRINFAEAKFSNQISDIRYLSDIRYPDYLDIRYLNVLHWISFCWRSSAGPRRAAPMIQMTKKSVNLATKYGVLMTILVSMAACSEHEIKTDAPAAQLRQPRRRSRRRRSRKPRTKQLLPAPPAPRKVAKSKPKALEEGARSSHRKAQKPNIRSPP